MAEGSFSVKKTGELVFSIRQSNQDELFSAFQVYFHSKRKIDKSTVNHSKFTLSSVKDLIKVISLVESKDTHNLVGYKLNQYNTFIQTFKETIRYKKVKSS